MGAHLIGEVAGVHLVTVGLAPWALHLDAMALQDGCFFKNTNAIIAYWPRRHPPKINLQHVENS